MARITTLEELRARIGAPGEAACKKVHSRLTDQEIGFVARAPFVVLGTAGADGLVEVSPKGDAPGFVEVVDDATLLIPDRPGNRLVFGMQNLLANPRVGLLFAVPGTPETLRVGGTAEILDDEDLLERFAARGRPATLVIRVHVQECYFHCGKAFLRSDLWEPSSWGPPVKIAWGREILGDPEADSQIAAAVAKEYRDNL